MVTSSDIQIALDADRQYRTLYRDVITIEDCLTSYEEEKKWFTEHQQDNYETSLTDHA